jgi:hypothetical protein
MSRCWVLEKGGDRCVLEQDHPPPHMGGYHTFTEILSAEDMARVIGIDFDSYKRETTKNLSDWKQLCLRLYKEHIGDNSFDFAEKDWEGLMAEARTKLTEAGLLKEGA